MRQVPLALELWMEAWRGQAATHRTGPAPGWDPGGGAPGDRTRTPVPAAGRAHLAANCILMPGSPPVLGHTHALPRPQRPCACFPPKDTEQKVTWLLCAQLAPAGTRPISWRTGCPGMGLADQPLPRTPILAHTPGSWEPWHWAPEPRGRTLPVPPPLPQHNWPGS